jgi:hypothetical protein
MWTIARAARLSYGHPVRPATSKTCAEAIVTQAITSGQLSAIFMAPSQLPRAKDPTDAPGQILGTENIQVVITQMGYAPGNRATGCADK